jgi:hypothetical protein
LALGVPVQFFLLLLMAPVGTILFLDQSRLLGAGVELLVKQAITPQALAVQAAVDQRLLLVK